MYSFAMIFAEAFPSSAIMYFVLWLVLWGKSYRRKVRRPWFAHLSGILITTALTAFVISVIGENTLPSISPVRNFAIPGLISALVIPAIFERYQKNFPPSPQD